ncbi:hypothetical protein BGX24_006164 [Mortierella sp. AD032]|nr:hypothetical protein BGX24_006164 [Mortierella sp. AD032]
MAMNIPLQQQQQQQQDQQQDQSLLVKQEPQAKQESLQLSTPQYHHQQPQHFQSMSSYTSQQQQPSNQNQHQTYGNFHGSSNSSMNSFSTLPPNPYSLNNHLMGLSMHSGSSTPTSGGGLNSSSLAPTPTSSGMMGGNTSGSTTPSMAHASAPSSPRLSGMQYGSSMSSHYNQGGSSLYHQHPYQQQHSSQHQYQSQQQPQHHSNLSSSNLTSSFYPASPPHQHQQQSYQSQHQQQQAGSSTSFNTMPPAPLRQQTQYAPLVPPLTDAQYAQYHQLLGSAFSSAASTPYHSNQSTPYSSMPTSPTLEYQQLSDPSLAQKPKRRQVKNACVNCQKACKKCDEGRPCTRCIKYGLTDTCVDSTRKVRKKGVKRGPYKRRPPPTQIGSASASTTPTLSHAVLPGGPVGYMSEPVTAMSSPTQSHMLPFTSSAMNQMSGPLDFGYGPSTGSSTGYSFQTQAQRMDNSSNYAPPYTTSYSGPSLYANPYGMNDNGSVGNPANSNNNMP